MSTSNVALPQAPTGSNDVARLLKQYGCGPVEFTGTDNALYERHLLFDHVLDLAAAGPRERYEAFARSVRDILSQRWVHTENTYETACRARGARRRLVRPPGSSDDDAGDRPRHGATSKAASEEAP